MGHVTNPRNAKVQESMLGTVLVVALWNNAGSLRNDIHICYLQPDEPWSKSGSPPLDQALYDGFQLFLFLIRKHAQLSPHLATLTWLWLKLLNSINASMPRLVPWLSIASFGHGSAEAASD